MEKRFLTLLPLLIFATALYRCSFAENTPVQGVEEVKEKKFLFAKEDGKVKMVKAEFTKFKDMQTGKVVTAMCSKGTCDSGKPGERSIQKEPFKDLGGKKIEPCSKVFMKNGKPDCQVNKEYIADKKGEKPMKFADAQDSQGSEDIDPDVAKHKMFGDEKEYPAPLPKVGSPFNCSGGACTKDPAYMKWFCTKGPGGATKSCGGV